MKEIILKLVEMFIGYLFFSGVFRFIKDFRIAIKNNKARHDH